MLVTGADRETQIRSLMAWIEITAHNPHLRPE
jgi:hypothetical protein